MGFVWLMTLTAILYLIEEKNNGFNLCLIISIYYIKWCFLPKVVNQVKIDSLSTNLCKMNTCQI